MRIQQDGRQIRKVAVTYLSRFLYESEILRKSVLEGASVFKFRSVIQYFFASYFYFSTFCQCVPNCSFAIYFHFLMIFFEASIISKYWKWQQRPRRLNICIWIRLSKLRGPSKTRPMLSAKNNNTTWQIIHFATPSEFLPSVWKSGASGNNRLF